MGFRIKLTQVIEIYYSQVGLYHHEFHHYFIVSEPENLEIVKVNDPINFSKDKLKINHLIRTGLQQSSRFMALNTFCCITIIPYSIGL